MAKAMSCGKPVVSTSLPTGVCEVNAAGVTGREVAPNDPEALRAAMLELAGNPELRTRFGAAGRERDGAEHHLGETETREAMIDLAADATLSLLFKSVRT